MELRIRIIAVLAAMAASIMPLGAQTPPPRSLTMGPIDPYLIANRSAEIALARSAAPASISAHAEVLVLDRHGFEVAVPGTNHYVCLVERSWDATPSDSPKYWNPESRGPDCLNPAAARSYLPIVLLKTRLALAGESGGQIAQAVEAAFNQSKLPALEPGAMSYMLSKQAFFGPGQGDWHPHVMFFVPFTQRNSWGANLPGSPIFASDDAPDRLTVFMIPVAHWSDGTPDPRAGS